MKKVIEHFYCNDNQLAKREERTLFDAIVLNDYELFVNLLTIDFNINLSNERGVTLLMKAIEEECIPMIHYLIKHDADLYLMDMNLETAEDYAKRAMNPEILNILQRS